MRLPLVATAAAIAAFALFGAFRSNVPDPIGVGADAGTPPCGTTELGAPANAEDEVASVRRESCSGTARGEVTYFVFLHKSIVDDDRDNLIFRYEPAYDRWLLPPHVAWLDEHTLAIALDARSVERVTKRVTELDGIEIRYAQFRELAAFRSSCPCNTGPRDVLIPVRPRVDVVETVEAGVEVRDLARRRHAHQRIGRYLQ